MKNEKYFIGLDVGTDSVGYAVSDCKYTLLKHKGEPMWGVHLFEGAKTGEERRGFRTARRRLDRKQQRVKLIDDIFASEIGKIDTKFFIRKKESALWRDDSAEPFCVFNDAGYTDKQYHKQYPTIHHLIWDLISNKDPHDVRLVYIAVAWLVAHRGHFLNEVSKDNIKDVLDIKQVYENFMSFFNDEKPWKDVDVLEFGNIIKKKNGVTAKYKELCNFLYNSNKAGKEISDEFPWSKEGILKLICGGEYSAKNLFGKDEYSELSSLKMSMKDEDLAGVLQNLGDDAELIIRIKSLYDWTVLSDILSDGFYISESKIKVYEQHKKDLKQLKAFVKKYIPNKYNEVFREDKETLDNYVAYSGNFKGSTEKSNQKKKNKELFCKYIDNLFKKVDVCKDDEEAFSDMKKRLELRTFMPKQIDSDNRVLPYQVYWIELDMILKNASKYLPFLNDKNDGYTNCEKILSVFEFRVPYFVGPLNNHGKNSWFVRASEGKILPWNFNERVDIDQSEEEFIKRMTNKCTYLLDCDVVPKCSLLYQKFTVLNEINCISVSGKRISVALKQEIYNELFLKKKRVTVKAIKDFLYSVGAYTKTDLETFSGLDINVNSSLSSHIDFNNLINSGCLSEIDVEKIIERSTYSESKIRFSSWLERNFSNLSEKDRKYICSLKFKDFGRLSREFLCEFEGADAETGEVHSIIQWMWETNNNLNEILSERYSFLHDIEVYKKEYFDANPKTLSDRLDEMYISNGVKRPIIRALDVVSDVVKVCGHAPEKIFVEMARGESDEKERPKTRLKQLKEFYSKIDSEEVRELENALDAMGDDADNKLQSERLYLYFLQLGKCMYSEKPISLSELSAERYDVDHIYPRSKIKDDSILNNKVLVLSTINDEKKATYPISAEIRQSRQGFWKKLYDNKLITDEKYKRLTRSTPFTEDEEWGFINRQLVETRQSTKAISSLLKEKYPDTEIVYVKAGYVSEFRQDFDMLKCRSVNDLHHAKDAYLNIVVGNVYHECFTKKWYLENKNNYSIKAKKLFAKERIRDGKVLWNGTASLEMVSKTVKEKNSVHITKYSFCRHGGFFDQMPKKSSLNLEKRKKDLPTEKYGGYNKTTASFFCLVKFTMGKKTDLWIMPVELMIGDKFLNDEKFAEIYAFEQLSKVNSKKIDSVSFPIGRRALKINTMFEFDGTKMTINGKANGGSTIVWSMIKPLIIGYQWETYIKKLEKFHEKKKKNPNMKYMQKYDGISIEENLQLYDLLVEKLKSKAYIKRSGNPFEALEKGREIFAEKDIFSQAHCLLEIVAVFGREAGGCDLSDAGATPRAAANTTSGFVSNLKKKFSDVRIIDISSSGLYESKSENLLELL